MRRAVGMEPVGKGKPFVVRLAVQIPSIQIMDIGITSSPLCHDRAEDVPDNFKRQLACSGTFRIADRSELELAVNEIGETWAGGVFVDRAKDRGHDQQRRGLVAFADRVEKAVYCRPQPAPPHQVEIHDIESKLEADAIGWLLPDRAGNELIEQCAAAQAQVQEIDPSLRCSDRRPCSARVGRVRTVADRASMMQPDALVRP